MLKLNSARMPTLAALALAYALSSACKRPSPTPTKAQSTVVANAARSPSSAAPALSQVAPPSSAAPVEPELTQLLERWNSATNAADGAVLAALYAPHLSLYGRIESNTQAAAKKVAARRKDPSFEQTLSAVEWAERANGDREAQFDKRSHTSASDRSVRAYLLVRRIGGALRIVDEGDQQTDRVLAAKRDTIANNWGERFFKCAECEQPDERPQAFPPLGPSPVTSSVPIPPGAPATIEYARLMLPRFASAVDLPTFVNVTQESGNGDGRWFNFAAPGTADGGAGALLLDCAAGGFWYDDQPQPGKPEPGHASHPEITATEKTFRKSDGLHYEKYIYSPERIENYVLCTIDPQYEAYFLAIAQRAGRSLRALSGGMYDRPDRDSDPF